MDSLLQPLQGLAEFAEAEELQKAGKGRTAISGCVESQKAHLLAGLLGEKTGALILAENDLKAKEFYEDFRMYDPEVLLYPAKDLMFYQADIQGNLLTRQRIRVLKALLEQKKVRVITSLGSCMEYLMPLEDVKGGILTFRNDSQVDLERLKIQLVEMGYERAAQVEASGQFSVRGGIIDIFPLTEENPWRIELWGDEIDSIRSFDAESQRSIENLEEISVYPAAELILSRRQIEEGIREIEKETGE